MKPRTRLLKQYFEIDNLTQYQLSVNEKLREKIYKKMVTMYSNEYDRTNRMFQKDMLTLDEFTEKLQYDHTFFRVLDWYKQSTKNSIIALIYQIDQDEFKEKFMKKKSKRKSKV